MQIEIESKNRYIVAILDQAEAASVNDAAFRAVIRGDLVAAFSSSDLDSADLLIELPDGTRIDTSDWETAIA